MLCDLDGPEIDLLRSVCAERRVWGCFFLMERNPNGAPFNSGVIVDARGEAPARRRARFGDDPQVGPGGDAGPRQFGGGNAQGPGTAHDDIEAVAQSTDPFDPRCPPRLSPGSNCPPMTSRSGPTFSLPAEPGTDDASR